MSLSTQQKLKVVETLKNSLRNKFAKYKPETSAMPFHTRLLGKDRLALYQFIHSLITNFGLTIFEPVALSIAESKFNVAKSQYKVGDRISEDSLYVIQKIMDNLTSATTRPDKIKELELIRQSINPSKTRKTKPTVTDLFLQDRKGNTFLIDIKTAKPNKGNFKEFKRTLLEWAAVALLNDPNDKINTLLAIPYNPYEPNPYARWTMAGMIDIKNELMVGKEFWDFLGGKGTYDDLLICFETAGIDMRDEIDNYFSKFNR
ncbi:TdeIII family type II restriction endonuclease [Melioribacter sp. Ez-97]|uniref:TdeIII family type II restriction endonuclease n=1 Tax=Melioribacter sp. Ez-97 TaxID=3423434 RepID=UPI003ED89B1C